MIRIFLLAGCLGPLACVTVKAQTLLPLPNAKTITEAECSIARLGSSIPVASIRLPVSTVTLSAPRWVPATGTAVARCEVDGAMAPIDPASTARPINFRVWLPAAWNGRAAQQGGGGMNGSIPDLNGGRYLIAGKTPAQHGFVTYGSDSGHQNAPAARGPAPANGLAPGNGPAPARGSVLTKITQSDDWSLNDEAMKNIGFMQLQKTRDAAMVLVERMYGSRPRFNYFTGNSQGGREGLTVAQRFPADYDGVLSNVPIVSFSSLMLAPTLIRIQERPIANWVTLAKVNAIRGEFMRQCDGLDGLVDGMINNYMGCRAIFDVSQGQPGRHPWHAKRCSHNIDPNPADETAAACLTDGQIATLEFVYTPYKFATPLANDVKAFGMYLPTTDPAGAGFIEAERFHGQDGAAADAPLYLAGRGLLGVIGFLQQDLAANPLDYVEGGPLNQRRQLISRDLDSTDPDLRPFAARGGKLIVTIGSNDTVASSGAQIDYYQAMLDRMGRPAVDAFARLFVIPQAGHPLSGSVYTTDGDGRPVAAGPIANTNERFAYLVDWVERRIAPGKTLQLSTEGRTMPLCSYPTYPRYSGGPANAATSYTCAEK